MLVQPIRSEFGNGTLTRPFIRRDSGIHRWNADQLLQHFQHRFTRERIGHF
jgi:hypothetical protein